MMTPTELAVKVKEGATGVFTVDGADLKVSDMTDTAAAVFGVDSRMFGKSMAHRGAILDFSSTDAELAKRIALVAKRQHRLVAESPA
jgi:hypothetical protein